MSSLSALDLKTTITINIQEIYNHAKTHNIDPELIHMGLNWIAERNDCRGPNPLNGYEFLSERFRILRNLYLENSNKQKFLEIISEKTKKIFAANLKNKEAEEGTSSSSSSSSSSSNSSSTSSSNEKLEQKKPETLSDSLAALSSKEKCSISVLLDKQEVVDLLNKGILTTAHLLKLTAEEKHKLANIFQGNVIEGRSAGIRSYFEKRTSNGEMAIKTALEIPFYLWNFPTIIDCIKDGDTQDLVKCGSEKLANLKNKDNVLIYISGTKTLPRKISFAEVNELTEAQLKNLNDILKPNELLTLPDGIRKKYTNRLCRQIMWGDNFKAKDLLGITKAVRRILKKILNPGQILHLLPKEIILNITPKTAKRLGHSQLRDLCKAEKMTWLEAITYPSIYFKHLRDEELVNDLIASDGGVVSAYFKLPLEKLFMITKDSFTQFVEEKDVKEVSNSAKLKAHLYIERKKALKIQRGTRQEQAIVKMKLSRLLEEDKIQLSRITTLNWSELKQIAKEMR